MRTPKIDKYRISATALFCSLLAVSGCHKKTPVASAPPPPPPPVAEPAQPPPPAPPTIDSFSAEPKTVERGQSATLRWSVSNATDISIDGGIGSVTSNGSREIAPANSATYILTAKGPGGAVSRSASLEVTLPPPPSEPPAKVPTATAGEILASEAHDAYFDYDQSGIRSDAQEALASDADVLKRIFQNFPGFNVIIEGNCDERGSAEYNIALGDRRAISARDFLIQLGVPADRMSTVSYGKDRPVCTEQSETCYQANRHVHFSPAATNSITSGDANH